MTLLEIVGDISNILFDYIIITTWPGGSGGIGEYNGKIYRANMMVGDLMTVEEVTTWSGPLRRGHNGADEETERQGGRS